MLFFKLALRLGELLINKLLVTVSDFFIQESYKYLHSAWKTSQKVDFVWIKYQRV